MSQVAVAGLLTVLVSFLDVKNSTSFICSSTLYICMFSAHVKILSLSAVILGKSHYVLYGLVAAMQPRMLVTFDEELRPLPVSVRVGQVCYVHVSHDQTTILLYHEVMIFSLCRLLMWWVRRVNPRPSQVFRLTPHQCCLLMAREQNWPQRSTAPSRLFSRASSYCAKTPTMTPRR